MEMKEIERILKDTLEPIKEADGTISLNYNQTAKAIEQYVQEEIDKVHQKYYFSDVHASEILNDSQEQEVIKARIDEIEYICECVDTETYGNFNKDERISSLKKGLSNGTH
jgi:hypothetical protein